MLIQINQKKLTRVDVLKVASYLIAWSPHSNFSNLSKSIKQEDRILEYMHKTPTQNYLYFQFALKSL
ncbi:protein of unknown function [Candidatus Nitrosocosmicus franklandus]|uniref:Uncharacterized protein n=1 Tax=Candidatus Nitrosocosmicus franklandianus TaxID=1798806 RepID=A0A484ICL4_9ARCH|nr:protein of unknown function [Candidatus Nitrosocosmicus franklandus]